MEDPTVLLRRLALLKARSSKLITQAELQRLDTPESIEDDEGRLSLLRVALDATVRGDISEELFHTWIAVPTVTASEVHSPLREPGLSGGTGELAHSEAKTKGSAGEPSEKGEYEQFNPTSMCRPSSQLHLELAATLQENGIASLSGPQRQLTDLYLAHPTSNLVVTGGIDSLQSPVVFEMAADVALKANDETHRELAMQDEVWGPETDATRLRLPTARQPQATISPSVLIMVPNKTIGEPIARGMRKLRDQSKLPFTIQCVLDELRLPHHTTRHIFPAIDIAITTCSILSEKLDRHTFFLGDGDGSYLRQVIWIDADQIFDIERLVEYQEKLSRDIDSYRPIYRPPGASKATLKAQENKLKPQKQFDNVIRHMEGCDVPVRHVLLSSQLGQTSAQRILARLVQPNESKSVLEIGLSSALPFEQLYGGQPGATRPQGDRVHHQEVPQKRNASTLLGKQDGVTNKAPRIDGRPAASPRDRASDVVAHGRSSVIDATEREIARRTAFSPSDTSISYAVKIDLSDKPIFKPLIGDPSRTRLSQVTGAKKYEEKAPSPLKETKSATPNTRHAEADHPSTPATSQAQQSNIKSSDQRSTSNTPANSSNNHEAASTTLTLSNFPQHDRICPVQTVQEHCDPSCGHIGICWVKDCSGDCGKIHGRPCTFWVINKNTCSKVACYQKMSHDEAWKAIYRRLREHRKTFAKQV